MAKTESVELQLDRQSCALDRLLAEVRGGIRSQQHFDQLEEQASAIGAGLRAAFRGSRR